MGAQTNIQWCDLTWNIAVGCRKVDADCKFCYMYRESLNGTRYQPREVRKTKTVFDLPLRYKETESKVWSGPPLVFTSSLTDVFIEEIDHFRHEMWDIIRQCPHLTFQILTKRPERIMAHLPEDWGDGWDNVWLGTSIGHEGAMHRYYDLEQVRAKTKFISFEPLWGPLHEVLNNFSGYELRHVQWVIIGGESGNEIGQYRYRQCLPFWIDDIRHIFQGAGVPVFIKQLGTHIAKNLELKDRHGGDINEWPEHLKVREFPQK